MIGQERQGLDRLGRVEETQRPGLAAPPGLCRLETFERRDGRDRPLRQVAIARRQPMDAPRAEAACQAIQQI